VSHFDSQAVPRVGRLFRLQWEPAQDAYVLLYPEGMVKLNQSAGEIMKRCDGVKSVSAVVDELETAFATTGLAPEVVGFFRLAEEKGWITWGNA
jgi:pyrroloquinoline quinone biosynthesis protein D